MAELQHQAADLSDEAPTLEITHILTDAEARAVLADITQEVELANVLAVAELGTTADTINTLPVGTPSPLLVERDPFAFKADSIAPVAITASLPPAAPPTKRQATNPEIAARTKALRAEPTQVLPRILLTRIQETMKKQARTALMLVAAFGSWAFFASFAALGAYGVVVAVRTHEQANEAVESAATTPPSSDRPAAAALPAHPVFIAEPVPERPRASALASADDGADDARPGVGKLGILRFAHATHGVLVDGAPHKVTGGALFVTCGAHRVRVPHGSSHTVNVPCGRTVTL